MKSNSIVRDLFKRFDLQLIKFSLMAKLKLLPKLSVGQKVVGKLIEYDSDKAIFEFQDEETRVQLSMFNVLEQALDAGDYEGEIVEIERTPEGYEIFTHDEWPKEKPKS